MITPQEYFALHHAWIDASIMLVVVSVCKRWHNTIIFVVQIKTHNMLTHCIIHQLTIHSYNDYIKNDINFMHSRVDCIQLRYKILQKPSSEGGATL